MASHENIPMTFRNKFLIVIFYMILAAVSTAVVLYGNIHGFYLNPDSIQ